MTKRKILIVDDEPKMQRVLEIMLADQGFDTLKASNGRDALAQLETTAVDLVITDLRMPEMDGIELVKKLATKQVFPPTIVISAHGSVDSAVEAMRLGAIDYITRPFEVAQLDLAVARGLKLGKIKKENNYLRAERDSAWQTFIGDSEPMRTMFEDIASVAPSQLAVLVTGETGTGKELVARAIHQASGRNGLFVPVNCAGIPETLLESELFGHLKGAFTGATSARVGKFELADGGTLFLDEITEMPTALQSSLLRVLQEHSIERLGSNEPIALDLRIIAATNREPSDALSQNLLREDLFYRLNGFSILVPKLSDRNKDIITLANHFLEKHARELGRETPELTSSAESILMEYPWPGNVRELENLMGRVVLLNIEKPIETRIAQVLKNVAITPSKPNLKQVSANENSLQDNLDAVESDLIRDALEQCNGNKVKAARLLEISERSLWYKIKKFSME